jgi:hypothetical protein
VLDFKLKGLLLETVDALSSFFIVFVVTLLFLKESSSFSTVIFLFFSLALKREISESPDSSVSSLYFLKALNGLFF